MNSRLLSFFIGLNLNKVLNELQSKKQITMERQKYEIDGNRLQESILLLKEEVLNLTNSIESVTIDIDQIKKELEIKQLKSMEFIKINEEKKKKKFDIQNNINLTNKELMNLNNRIDILNDNINNDTKLPYSVRNVINNIRLKGIHGVLGKLIDVPEKYVTAIETSLGANTNVIVVENENCAKEAINYLKENRLGRATFFPMSIIKARNVMFEDLAKIKDIDGYIGTADSLVKYDEKYRGIVLNQLGNVIVVDNIDTLNKIGKLIQYKYKIVSLEGEISFAGGAITGGASKGTNGVMNQKYELDELKKQMTDKKKKLGVLEDSLTKINLEIEKVSSDLENNQRSVVLLTEQVNLKTDHLKDLHDSYNIKNNELIGVQNKEDNTLDKELESILKHHIEFKYENYNYILKRRLLSLKSLYQKYLSRYSSLFEYIKFVNEYRGYVKEINDKNIGFYKVYLQYKTPVFFFKIFNCSIKPTLYISKKVIVSGRFFSSLAKSIGIFESNLQFSYISKL